MLDLANFRNAVKRFLADTVGSSEVIASDYLPDTATNGGVAYIVNSVDGISDLAGETIIQSVSFTLYVGKKTREEVDDVIKKLTDIPVRYHNDYCSHLVLSNVSDVQFNPNNDIWFGSIVTLIVYR